MSENKIVEEKKGEDENGKKDNIDNIDNSNNDNNIIIQNNVENNKEEQKQDIIKNDENNNQKELEKDILLSSINDLLKINNKLKNSLFNVIKKVDKNIIDRLEPEKYVKILKLDNKRILTYKLFSLYANYNENPSLFKDKDNIFLQKFYFNYWHKNLNQKNDE